MTLTRDRADAPDPARVAARFSAAAESYDGAAGVQRRAVAVLCRELDSVPAPTHVADLGCGTGLLTAAVTRRWPHAAVTGLDVARGMIARCRATLPHARFVEADAAHATPPHGIDAVVSSFALHWLADPPGTLRAWTAALPPGGLAAVAVPVTGSLARLAEAYAEATGRPWPGVRYQPLAAYRDALTAGGATVQTAREAVCTQTHAGARDALRGLRALGATAPVAGAGRPASPGRVRTALTALRDGGGAVHLSFRVGVLVAVKPA
jgi:ubiquinone/menaquinone biosynthesis C-methylase UbiE